MVKWRVSRGRRDASETARKRWRGDVYGAGREINKASRCRGENFVLSSLAGTMYAMERETRAGGEGRVES